MRHSSGIAPAAFLVAVLIAACGSDANPPLDNEPFAHLACRLDEPAIAGLRSRADDFGRENNLSRKLVEIKPETKEFSLLLYDDDLNISLISSGAHKNSFITGVARAAPSAGQRYLFDRFMALVRGECSPNRG